MSASAVDAPIRDRPLSWSRTVARESVHRTSAAEVLLTDVRPLDGGGFEAAASWPRSHPTFPRDGGSLHSPLILAETLRQLGIYIPLHYFHIPPAARLIITDLFFEIDLDEEPDAGFGATDITCRVHRPEVRSGRSGEVTGLRLAVDFLTGGSTFAQAGGGVRIMGEQRYAEIRGAASALSPPAPAAGLVRPAASDLAVPSRLDVLIGRHGDATVLCPADPRHPFFFDHATDHVPGMVLLEAVRQATAVASQGALLRPRRGRLTAARFTEFDPPARVVCVPHHRTCVFGVLQEGARTAFGVLGYP
ncbi:ScbA/BarX family gamma-butyrolactone biosynthesis protein [Actinacidiphila bryophytorum]|uniref:A-factor biosynthesis protein n=1 Tax=Actinacidiphila bryophytorum TaxID=1436133 RepID=A0A9W4H457_9ACTN|nr:ScbA/BarX family gamma-butyrolactone biosynthesis protein [Actinacidiphila bryophytorum]MBM9435928.1 A-factor biosynthesis protein [Actinacidiphila bryophytorum]MBN6541509.1 A-factor biosynthesis protein [Actinacidiphila bryophytorum]CAG7649512.1 A-factor biosynthesis protein [Actinacidiphila bryophytorum]